MTSRYDQLMGQAQTTLAGARKVAASLPKPPARVMAAKPRPRPSAAPKAVLAKPSPSAGAMAERVGTEQAYGIGRGAQNLFRKRPSGYLGD